ncbi:hypothetical protein CKM354_000740800 [Cercospora kikuchii]|uniref:Uncharacterized protein n=1 Tax=Cercospora kikuchii TaxID=84275 RepID=A0A9P3FIS5_9PEZI|nr:uncharacterized protein CKM354_000740800 [Cercospora kikuchii]GIZ44204.1 hypothetical protein CKM354_000740800 [Cercospora kikuchii]
MHSESESPAQFMEDSEGDEEQGRSDGYPAKRQRLVDLPRKACSLSTTPSTPKHQTGLTALPSVEKIQAYSSTCHIMPSEPNGDHADVIFETAERRAIETGHLEPADASGETHERSRFDTALQIPRDNVLTQHATPAQEQEFQNHARLARSVARDAQSSIRPRGAWSSQAQQSSASTSVSKSQDLLIHADTLEVIDTELPGSGRDTSARLPHVESAAAGPTATAGRSDLVCFGMIPHAACDTLYISTHVTTEDASASGPATTYLRFNLTVRDGRLFVGTPSGREVAHLSTRLTRALLEIMNLNGVGCEVFVEGGQLTSFLDAAARTRNSKFLYVDIHILGPIESSQRVGVSLSLNGLYLQDPRVTCDTREYFNPQVLDLQVSQPDIMLHELFMEMTTKRRKAEQGSAWNTALDDMSQHALNANAVDVDVAIVTTPILPHQKEALDFMRQREIGGENLNCSMRFWIHDRTENDRAVYRHKITADERFQQQLEPQELMDSWLAQLQQHTGSGKLKVSRYHGHERARLADDLVDNDIVITTYGTIAKEYIKPRRRVLYHMCFFRIILDEAHIIRTRRTKLFAAVVELEAAHHWCLTGTPISNKIDDLYSLLHFCRVPLLGNDLIFRQHVTVPSGKSVQRGGNILRETLKPICLRRNIGIIGLARPEAIEKEVIFSPAEEKHYHQIFETGRGAIDAAVSGHTGKSTRIIMLKILLELRIFCSQGTFRQNGFLADGQPLDSDELFTLLEESEDAYCASCNSKITGINQDDDDGDSGVLGDCSHMLCMTCHNSRASIGPPKECPICKRTFEVQLVNPSSDTPNTPSAVKKHCSKLNALMQDLQSSQNAQALEKSVVFSYWRKTIDLAADICSQNGIRAVVVHGKTLQADRTKILEQFAEDPTISALLMTIGTGGLGLTINVASRVHILEPQWNPSVEEQAIGRVVRLGQEKPITVIRYIVNESIERQIQGYQKRKKALAASGFGHHSDNTSTEETVRLNAAYIA